MFSKSMLLLVLPVAMALLAGAVLPFQAAGNAAVGRALGHWLWGAFTSLTVSILVVIAALLIIRVPAPDMGKALQGPWWLWIGGVLGALYVAGAAALTPKLGAAGFLVLVVAGQIITAVLADHYGVMGLGGKPLSLARVAGVVLILCGVLLVQGPWATASPSHSTAAVKGQEN
ncbi:DMT family transporter [Pseudomonas putida]|uniref:DMT family transporter n=1 Tax=Pseudomonas putida TaxID=303 RepID=UPI0023E446AB|nr:DMT family transporter [Pseudomonas putida]MDF3928392.1 DMT family transporter [Pseudomonas putida]